MRRCVLLEHTIGCYMYIQNAKASKPRKSKQTTSSNQINLYKLNVHQSRNSFQITHACGAHTHTQFYKLHSAISPSQVWPVDGRGRIWDGRIRGVRVYTERPKSKSICLHVPIGATTVAGQKEVQVAGHQGPGPETDCLTEVGGSRRCTEMPLT